ncbi:hypothetical protein GTZ89_46180 [Streptomyces sp. SID8382]|uniref:hypothetical protein n=1 Tax=Streptomyces malaysiensis TaxID=92644 RepID=UPI000C2BC22D|nr:MULTISPECIES: hypothetical protein [unclassified Streptomyces]AUA16748.1 hypothetical protein CFP59_08939 [Streptomyces sp. M56]MYX62786.1 hypothetical protein [Streptomyces sp. SID8382]
MHSPHRPARYNFDDRRDADSPAFMTGTLPPKVPDVFNPILHRTVGSVLAQCTPMDLIGSHQYRGAERDQAAAARFVARRFPQPPDLERMVVTNGTRRPLRPGQRRHGWSDAGRGLMHDGQREETIR